MKNVGIKKKKSEIPPPDTRWQKSSGSSGGESLTWEKFLALIFTSFSTSCCRWKVSSCSLFSASSLRLLSSSSTCRRARLSRS